MFVGCSEISVFLLNMCNMLELSGLLVCLGRLVNFLSAWEVGRGGGVGWTEVSGLWFARRDQYPGWHYEWKFWIFSINFERNFLKKENLSFKKKIENSFTVETTTTESVTYPYKTALSEANVKANIMESTKWTYHKEHSFASIYSTFLKFCFSIRTCYKEYQLPKCPYSYFPKELELYLRVLFPCEYPLNLFCCNH